VRTSGQSDVKLADILEEQCRVSVVENVPRNNKGPKRITKKNKKKGRTFGLAKAADIATGREVVNLVEDEDECGEGNAGRENSGNENSKERRRMREGGEGGEEEDGARERRGATSLPITESMLTLTERVKMRLAKEQRASIDAVTPGLFSFDDHCLHHIQPGSPMSLC
jgi:hypothetical protein